MFQALAATADDHGHGHAEAHAEHPTSTGIENKKVLMWLFLASDCMFFGTLISTHLVYRKVYPFGALEKGIVNVTGSFDIELTSFSTFILLMSSFLMALAVSAMHKGQMKSFRRATVGVMFFGLIFLGCQVFEFTHFFDGHAKYNYTVKLAPNTTHPTGEVLYGEYQGPADGDRAKADLAEHLYAAHPDWLVVPPNLTPAERVLPAAQLVAKYPTLLTVPYTATAEEKALSPVAQVTKHPEWFILPPEVPATDRSLSPAEQVAKFPGWMVATMKQTAVEKPSLSMQNSVFGSTFFLMTGTHGCHVAIGVLWLAAMFFFSFSGQMEKNMHGAAIDVEVAGLYWHFVDIVWIVIFTAVYLVEYIPGYGPIA